MWRNAPDWSGAFATTWWGRRRILKPVNRRPTVKDREVIYRRFRGCDWFTLYALLSTSHTHSYSRSYTCGICDVHEGGLVVRRQYCEVRWLNLKSRSRILPPRSILKSRSRILPPRSNMNGVSGRLIDLRASDGHWDAHIVSEMVNRHAVILVSTTSGSSSMDLRI